MARLLIVALLAAAAIAPASAATAAAPPAPDTAHRVSAAARATRTSPQRRNPVTTAAAIARKYWGAVPCRGQIKIRAGQPLAAGLDPTTDAWVTFNSSLGANNLEAPAASYTGCAISLARWQWPSRTDMESDWGMFCLTVVHEVGHLLGHGHSQRRGSVMVPTFTSEANVPRACNATWLKAWR